MIKLESTKTKTKKRVGRGLSAGQGKTAGRGTKGQKSRSGFNIPKRFEGGQTPLSMRLPKLPGFKSHHKKAHILSLDILSANYKDNEVITLESLYQKGLLVRGEQAKILNNGKLTKKISVSPEVKVSDSIKDLFSIVEEKETPKKKAKKVIQKTEDQEKKK